MAPTDLKWSLSQAKTLAYSLMVFLSLHTVTGTATSHTYVLSKTLLLARTNASLSVSDCVLLHFSQECPDGMDVWMVRMYLQQSEKTAFQEKLLLNS